MDEELLIAVFAIIGWIAIVALYAYLLWIVLDWLLGILHAPLTVKIALWLLLLLTLSSGIRIKIKREG